MKTPTHSEGGKWGAISMGVKKKTFRQRALQRKRKQSKAASSDPPLPAIIVIMIVILGSFVSIGYAIGGGNKDDVSAQAKANIEARDKIIFGYRSETNTHWAICDEDWNQFTVHCHEKPNRENVIVLDTAPVFQGSGK